jgi:hypothetical protein
MQTQRQFISLKHPLCRVLKCIAACHHAGSGYNPSIMCLYDSPVDGAGTAQIVCSKDHIFEIRIHGLENRSLPIGDSLIIPNNRQSTLE